MPDLQLSSAADLDLDALAALFTAGYSDYYVPIHVERPALEFMASAFDLDLEASRVATSGGEPVGFCALGVRGGEGWIGGLGVVAGSRRHGIGETLMLATLDEARTRGITEVRLEVIRENERAIPLYERLGFARTREREVWSLAGGAGRAEEIPAADAHDVTRTRRAVREPWQRDDGTIAQLGDATGLRAGAGAAVVRVSNGRVSLLQAAGDDAELRELVAAARSLGVGLTVLNVPPDHPLAPVLADLGGRVDVTQYEMSLAL